MKEMLIGARGPPRPAPTRVCVPARCLWLFLDKFEMKVFVVSPNLLFICRGLILLTTQNPRYEISHQLSDGTILI